jgi:hypothetical protein
MQLDKVRSLFIQLLATPANALHAHNTLKNALLNEPSILSETL